MTPKHTLYRLSEPGDAASLRALWMHNQELFGKPLKLGWPTIVAERNNVIIGFLSTYLDHEIITAGPLILRKGAAPFTTLRLIEAYENILRIAGVKTYFFFFEDQNDRWMKFAAKLGVEPYSVDHNGKWFRRNLSHG